MLGISKLVADRRVGERRVNGADTFSEQTALPPAPAPLFNALEPQIKPSIISDAVCFVGEFTSKGAIHIDGNAKGTVEAESVTIGASGSLDGKVSCRKLHIKGGFSGSATCDDLIIDHEAMVQASLTCRTLQVERGARVNGEVVIVQDA
jgi:cytoskeletal protein CcmA (bactofilin family)